MREREGGVNVITVHCTTKNIVKNLNQSIFKNKKTRAVVYSSSSDMQTNILKLPYQRVNEKKEREALLQNSSNFPKASGHCA